MAQQLESLINRLEQVTQRLENLKVGGKADSSSGSGPSVPPQVEAYDEYVKSFVQPFLDTCAKLGGPLDKAKDLVSQGFAEVRSLVARAAQSKKPSDEELGKALLPLNKLFGDLTNLRMDNRQNPLFNHLYSIDEGIKCLAWVGVPNITVSYVKDMVNAAQFYLNKVLTEYRKKENGEVHVQFVDQLKQLITELANYVKEHHLTGLTFNPKGGDFASATSTSSPQPQPQQQPKQEQPKQEQPQQPKPQTGAPKPSVDLLASISAKKDSAASALNRVTDDMKTKNRTDKSSIVSADAVKKTTVSKANEKFNGTPKFELEKGVGEKWVVEYQQGKQDLAITETNLKQNVYIYRSLNSVITIQGKVKGIVVDGCKKVAVVADSVVSSIEFVNCESVQLQINGEAPTVSVDKTDGFQLFLTKSSLETKLITSKSSEMNINVPTKDGDDVAEHPVPEQYVTSYDANTGKFTTTINNVFM